MGGRNRGKSLTFPFAGEQETEPLLKIWHNLETARGYDVRPRSFEGGEMLGPFAKTKIWGGNLGYPVAVKGQKNKDIEKI